MINRSALPELISPSAQRRRVSAMIAFHNRRIRQLFDDDGLLREQRTYDTRVHLWSSLALLAGDAADIEMGNALLRKGVESKTGHFWGSAAVLILARFADKLASDLRSRLLQRLAEAIPGEAGQTFRGYNDNFPAMAAVTTLLGSQLVGHSACVDLGMANLQSAVELLSRRGVISEFCSPTYSAITLTCMAAIGQLCDDPATRSLAVQVEQRVWLDLAARFHPESGFVAGPYSRAYTADLAASPHNSAVVLYQAFGDVVTRHPLIGDGDYPPGFVMHGSGLETFLGHVSWHSAVDYHLTPELAELALNKPYPSSVHASSEQAAFPRNFWSMERHPRTPTMEFAAGPVNTFSHLTADYAIGLSDRQFLDGTQYTPLHAIYRRRRPAKTLADCSTLFTRFVIDDKKPELGHMIADEGRALGLGHENTAMLLYRARPAWGNSAKSDYAVAPIGSMKLSIVLTNFSQESAELWIGQQRFDRFTGNHAAMESVYLSDGTLLAAIHPLVPTDFGREAAIELSDFGQLRSISFVSFRGAKRTFSDVELLSCHSGVVVEFASTADWPDFAAFRAFHDRPVIRDTWRPDDGMRHVRYQREGLSLAMEISPISEGIKHRTINGQPAPEPRFHLNGQTPQGFSWL